VAPTTLPGRIRHPPGPPPEPVAHGTTHALTCWDAVAHDKTVGRWAGSGSGHDGREPQPGPRGTRVLLLESDFTRVRGRDMTRWKELPAGLDDAERQLVAQLRRLKDRAGLSLAALAAKTSYSSSSWERYLNGKKPVPRGAAEELAEVCGTPAERLLVLHEVAE